VEFRISDTFTVSLSRLQGDEQKLVKTTAFDLQLNPANPGHQLHKLDNVRDKNFWSVRVNRDIRLIVHRTQESLMLCYVAHHDDAYSWAERRKLEPHPTTGAAQFVEVRETVVEIPVELFVDTPTIDPSLTAKPLIFANRSEEELLGFGVPPDWIQDVLLANEDTLFNLADHLPNEAAEALLEIATGGQPAPKMVLATGDNPFSHPDAQRRFRTIENHEELERALDFPWDRWTIFLHPVQRTIVQRDFAGPARVSGSAGTGKTVVALHRAAHLARTYPDSTTLLTTFSNPLANLLRSKLNILLRSEPKLAERIIVDSLQTVGERLYRGQLGELKLASDFAVRDVIAAHASGSPFRPTFILSEWLQVVDAFGLTSWDEYRDVRRLGRKTRLREEQRVQLWSIFEAVLSELKSKGLLTPSNVFFRLAEAIPARNHPPYEFAIVDEAQDLSVAQLRFLAALGWKRPNALFFAGDLGQRIFQQPLSWLSQGVDVRGRSKTLQINYRTSHQIRAQADRLLSATVTDLDGITEERKGTVSVFNGPQPVVRTFSSVKDEEQAVSEWLKDLCGQGVHPHEFGVFVRTSMEIPRAIAAVERAGLKYQILDKDLETTAGSVPVATMHLAKGLEFKAVAVMACDDEIIPLGERLEQASEFADLEEAYNTERHLLYVACTRARDHLLVTSGGSPSEFLDDFRLP